jgi:hypothetical protein
MPRLKAWRTDGRLDVTDCVRRFARPQNSNTTASIDRRKSWPLELQSTRCAARVRHLAVSVVPARRVGRLSGRSTDSRVERAFAPPRLESPVEGLAYRDYRKRRRENLFRGPRPDAAVDAWLTRARVPWTRPSEGELNPGCARSIDALQSSAIALRRVEHAVIAQILDDGLRRGFGRCGNRVDRHLRVLRRLVRGIDPCEVLELAEPGFPI